MPAEADNSSFSKSSHEKSQTKLSINRNPAIDGYFLVTSPREGGLVKPTVTKYQLLPLFGGRSQVPAEANKKDAIPHSHAGLHVARETHNTGKTSKSHRNKNPIGTLDQRVFHPQQQVGNDEPGILFGTGRHAAFPQTVQIGHPASP